MAEAMRAPIRFELSAEQKRQCARVSGLTLTDLELDEKQLWAMLLYTEAHARGRLAQARHLTCTIELTPEQQAIIRQATGREASRITLMLSGMDQAGYGRLTRCDESWRADSSLIPIGRSLVILPAGSTSDLPEGKHPILLATPSEPGCTVFGTGAHATTQLSLQLLEDRLEAGSRVLDLGTGSGVLAIAAARLGARPVLALDIEPAAVAMARENVAANGLSDIVQVEEGSVESAAAAPYDLVLANLLAGLLMCLAPDLARVVRPSGLLIASGIRDAASPVVADALCAAGFALQEARSHSQWTGLVLRRT